MKSLLAKVYSFLYGGERLLWYVFLFCIPLQARSIIEQTGGGWRFVEWRSISLFGTDILIFGLFVFWVAALISGKAKFVWRKGDWFLVGFVLVSGLSIFNSLNKSIGFYSWVKLFEFGLLYLFLRTYAYKTFPLRPTLWALVAGGATQAIIGFGQFLKQSDFGLQLFGESVLNQSLRGVASFYTESGDKLIRAYGLTPHPNVLAMILLLSLIALVFLFLASTKRNTGVIAGYVVIGTVLLFGLLSTFSRTTIVLTVMLALLVYLVSFVKTIGQRRSDFMKVSLFLLCGVVVFSLIFWPAVKSRMTVSPDEDAVILRGYYNRQALGSGTGLNLTGVGLGNFTEWLIKTYPGQESWRYQPVHNVFLLAYSETGILGVAMFLGFLFFIFAPAIKNFIRSPGLAAGLVLTAAGCLLFLGLFDHFSWTLQQGRIVWWGVLAAVAYL